MEDKGLYARAHGKVIELLPVLKGRHFASKDVWDLIGLGNLPEHAPYKEAIAKVLYNISQVNKEPLLRQVGKQYRIIEKDIPEIEWWIPSGKKPLELRWPRGVDDMTYFGFEDSTEIYPRDALVLAGEGNKGKTTFALNFLVENMDNYPCTYFSSEFSELKFRNRIERFDWVDIMKNGRPKFELLPRQQYYEDVISDRKDNINIIDWIRMDDDPWKIRAVIDSIMQPLDKGICLIVLQKRSYKSVGEGGEGSVDLSSAYFILSNQKLKVEKVKVPKAYDPNYKTFGFEIIKHGSRFNNIREIIKCKNCSGSGNHRGAECEDCFGIGYIDK